MFSAFKIQEMKDRTAAEADGETAIRFGKSGARFNSPSSH